MTDQDERFRALQESFKADLREFRDEFRIGIRDLRDAMNALPVVRHDVYMADRRADAAVRDAIADKVERKADATVVKEVSRRVLDLEGFNIWLVRLVVAAVVSGSVGLLFAVAR